MDIRMRRRFLKELLQHIYNGWANECVCSRNWSYFYIREQIQNSASYFLGDAKNDSLQRIYGISFPDTKQMTEYKKFIEEAGKRDHRKIGKVRMERSGHHKCRLGQ